MKIPVPVQLVDTIKTTIATSFKRELTAKQKDKILVSFLKVWFRILKKQIDIDTDFLFVSIRSEEFRDIKFNYNNKLYTYVDIIDLMKANELIYSNDRYKVGGFTKSYKVNPSFITNDCTIIEVDEAKIFKKRHCVSDWIDMYPEFTHLINSVYSIRIDLESYYKFIDSIIGKKYSHTKKRLVGKTNEGKIKYVKLNDKIMTPSKAYAIKIQALMFNLGHIWFSLSDTRRFYNSAINLPNVSHPFWLIDESSDLVEIDCSNSQPLLLSSFINHEQYRKDTEAGLFYDKIAEHLGIDRNEVKVLSFKNIFFQEKAINKKWSVIINEIWPGLIEQIEEIKAESPLWSRLQSAEADIWIKTCKESVFTVIVRHDSVVINEKYATIMIDELNKAFKQKGIKPTLKVKKLSETNDFIL